MILERLKTIEKDASEKVEFHKGRLSAVKNLEKYLQEIDCRYEVVLTRDRNKLKELFVSLKEDSLSSDEEELIEEIIQF